MPSQVDALPHQRIDLRRDHLGSRAGPVKAHLSVPKVIDEDEEDVWWSGIINFEANTCSSIELVP